VYDKDVHRETSTLLWNMVANGLLNRLVDYNCSVQGYADDVMILIGGKFLSTISYLMQGALNCLQSWCGGIELSVNEG
jgi:hypothetical protein